AARRERDAAGDRPGLGRRHRDQAVPRVAKRDTAGRKGVRRRSVGLADQPEQQLAGADLRVAEAPRLGVGDVHRGLRLAAEVHGHLQRRTTHGAGAPVTFSRIAYSEVVAVMNRWLRFGPPKTRFATSS